MGLFEQVISGGALNDKKFVCEDLRQKHSGREDGNSDFRGGDQLGVFKIKLELESQ